jgi:hypothetical protein
MKRFMPYDRFDDAAKMFEVSNGDWVAYLDYEKLLKKFEKLKAEKVRLATQFELRGSTLNRELENIVFVLDRVAYGGNFTCFSDSEWEVVNNALDHAKTATLKEKTND